MVSRVKAESISPDDLIAALQKTARQAERAGPDHPPHPRLREAQRAAAPAGAVAPDRRGRGGPGRHRAAPAQRRDPHLRGAAPAGDHGRSDPDRAGRAQPAEERGRSDRQRAVAAAATPHRAARRAPPHARGRRRDRVQRHRHGPGPEGGSHRPPLRSVLLDQGRGPGHRPEPVPHDRRVAPRPDAGTEPLQWYARPWGVDFRSPCRWNRIRAPDIAPAAPEVDNSKAPSATVPE